jgi:hypothetical protein
VIFHDITPGLRYNGWDIAAGAQTERRGGAGPVGGLLGGKDLTGRFLGDSLLHVGRFFKPSFPQRRFEKPSYQSISPI